MASWTHCDAAVITFNFNQRRSTQLITANVHSQRSAGLMMRIIRTFRRGATCGMHLRYSCHLGLNCVVPDVGEVHFGVTGVVSCLGYTCSWLRQTAGAAFQSLRLFARTRPRKIMKALSNRMPYKQSNWCSSPSTVCASVWLRVQRKGWMAILAAIVIVALVLGFLLHR